MATNNAAEMIPRIAIKGTLGVSGPLNSDYDALINKPQINGNELVGNKTNAELGIPTELADLTEDSTHRVVTDTQIGEWNAKSDFSGSYNDLTDVPDDLVEDAEYVHTDNNYTDEDQTKLGSIESGAEVNVQANWNETDTSSDAYIQNKPTIPAAQVNSDWTASSGVAEILHKPTLGTAAAKNYTGSVLENSTDLVESGAVKTAIDNAISSVYKPAGNKACAELISSLLVAANLGNVYNMTDDGVTTADFVEGAGKAIEAGDNVVIVDIGSSVYKFDLLSGMVDLSNYVQKSSTSGLIKNDGTIDQTAYAKQNEMSVSTSGDQTTIQLKNGTSATVINAHQDISGKANKSEMTVTPGTGSDADKTTIQLKSGTDATVLTQHQDISGKVDKEQGKGLSTEDYTTAEKSKLGDISEKAKKVASSSTNGHIEIDDVDTTVYDDTAVQTAIDNIEDELSTDSATIEGNPLNFSTLSAQNAESTIIDLEPIQDLHGYDKPWVGGAGANKWDEEWEVGTIDSDGNTTPSTVSLRSKNYIPVSPNTSYYFYRISNNRDVRCYFYDTNKDFISDSAIVLSSSQTFTTGANYAFMKFVFLYYVQDYTTYKNDIAINYPSTITTYSPYSNICPISGRSEIGILGCGKNIWNEQWESGKITATGEDYPSAEDIRTVGYIPVESGKSYYCHFGNATVANARFYDKNKTYVGYAGCCNTTITVPNDARYLRFYFNNTTYNHDVSINYDATDTSYHAYQQSNALTISFGQTVYGGQVDVEKGQLVVDKIHKNLGDLSWGQISSKRFYSADVKDFKYIESGNFKYATFFISSNYKSSYNSSALSQNGVIVCFRNEGYSNEPKERIFIRDDAKEDMTASAFKTAMDGVDFCYELATPITINLTPNTINLLKGVNNISTDGDKITLTYRDGSVATLGDLTSAVDNLDSKIDESKILTDTVTGDKYILVVTNGVLDIQQVSN